MLANPRPIIAIDSEPTTMELPNIYSISRTRARALEQIMNSPGCTIRITVTCGITQHDQSVITTVQPNQGDGNDEGEIPFETFTSSTRLQGRTGPYTGSHHSL